MPFSGGSGKFCETGAKKSPDGGLSEVEEDKSVHIADAYMCARGSNA